MTANIEQFTSAGVQLAWWALNNSNGYPMGPTGSIANGADSSMSQLQGINSLNLNLQQPRQVNVPGDDGVKSVFFFEPESLPSGDLALGVFDATFVSRSQGTLVYADGDWNVPVLQPDLPTYASMTLMTVSQGKSSASGSVGQAQWMVKIYPKVQVVPLGDAGLANATDTSFTHALIANKSDKLPWGTSFSAANNGTTQAAVYGPFLSEGKPLLHAHVGDASDTTLTLAKTPSAANGNKVKLWQNGTAKAYTTDYTVSGTTFTFAAAPGAGVVSIIRYEY